MNGHVCREAQRPIQAASFKEWDIACSKKRTGSEEGRISDILSHIVPRSLKSEAFHELPAESCTIQSCEELAQLVSVETTWPAMLILGPNDYDQNPAGLEEEVVFGDYVPIQYQLVGKILYDTEMSHYRSQVLLDDATYLYDDMLQGKLRRTGPSNQVLEDSRNVVLTFYSRTSASKVSVCSSIYYMYLH